MGTSPTLPNARHDAEELRVEAIDTDPEFLYTLTPGPPSLAASLSRAGILAPLVLTKDGKLISGLRRLWAARDLGMTTVPVRRARDAREAFLTGLWENLSHREFTALERGELLARLDRVAGIARQAIIATYLPVLGLGPSPAILTKHLTLTSLPPAVKDMAAQGRLKESHLVLLAGLTDREATAVATVFATISPSAGEARDLVKLFGDLAKRDNVGLTDTIARPDVTELLQNETVPRRQRVATLRRHLRTLTLPHLSRLENEAAALATAGGLTAPIHVKLPPDLSRGDVVISLRVRTGADVRAAVSVLGSDQGREALRRILGLLRGERESG